MILLKNKSISFILCLFLAITVFVLASCDSSKLPPDNETTDGTDSSSVEETTAPEKESLIPEGTNLRQIAADYMRKMGQIEWTAKEKMDFSKALSITDGLIYEPGKTYRGMPYANQQCGYEIFSANLDKDGIYTGPVSYQKCYGNTCTTSIKNAWYMVSNSIDFDYAIDMMPYYTETGILPLGDIPWDGYDEKNTTNSVLKKCDAQTVYEAYALLGLGDAVTRYLDSNGHARMVTGEIKVTRAGNGLIVPERSYMLLTDQNSHFVKTAAGELPSHWNVDRKFTFADLYKDGYLPVTIKELQEGICEEPEFKITNKPLSKTFTNTKAFRGLIDSNFKMILVSIALTDGNGNTVFAHTGIPEGTSYDLATLNDLFDLKTLGSGSYTYTVKATIGIGEYELLSINFSL